MQRTKSTNLLLALNTCLLVALLWALAGEGISLGPGGAQTAHAVMLGDPPVDKRGGIPDAGRQRTDLIKAMKRLNSNIDALEATLAKRKFAVNVANVKELADAIVRANR